MCGTTVQECLGIERKGHRIRWQIFLQLRVCFKQQPDVRTPPATLQGRSLIRTADDRRETKEICHVISET